MSEAFGLLHPQTNKKKKRGLCPHPSCRDALPPHHLSLWESFGKIQPYASWPSSLSSDTILDGDTALEPPPTSSSDAVSRPRYSTRRCHAKDDMTHLKETCDSGKPRQQRSYQPSTTRTSPVAKSPVGWGTEQPSTENLDLLRKATRTFGADQYLSLVNLHADRPHLSPSSKS